MRQRGGGDLSYPSTFPKEKAAADFECHHPVIFMPDKRTEASTGIRPAAHPFAEPSPGALVAPFLRCLGMY